MEHCGQSLSNSEVTVVGFDVVLRLVEAVAIEDFADLVGNNGSSLVDVEVDLEGVEVAGCNYEFSFPLFICCIILIFVDGNSCEEGSIWQR